MTIERIGSNDRMSKIVKHNNTIYLCGQTASADEWDIAEQTRRCLQQVEDLLLEAGSSTDNILSVTIYVRDMQDFAAMNQVWDAWVADKPKPARACVESHMARPNVLVELSVIAAQ
ncbi:RidA family protein [uncultured Psychromonas sp.]|uniref:RidA family protein n=1 Tax=uncultured Psychromonas sp. TaxID=173974 RepID=UPI00260514DB|nr:RidA family protein [uncultured Psychromonas sp.]